MRPLPTVITRGLEGLARAVLDGAIAGAAAGVIDGVTVLAGRDVVGLEVAVTALTVLGLAVLAGVVVGTPVILVARLVGRHPWLRAVRAGLVAPGPRRVEAVVALIGGLLLLVAAGVAVAVTVLSIGARARAPGAAAALIAAIAVGVGLAAIGLATAALPPLARALGRRAWARCLTTGRVGGAALLLTVAAALDAVDELLARAAPAFDARPIIGATMQLACALIVAAVGVAAWLGPRRAAIALAVSTTLIGGALLAVGRADVTRAAITEHGLAAGGALRGLWRLTDDDGDGFGDGFGAADCDDADPRIHPHALDLAGDGVDGNCAGGDPDPAVIAAARAARPSAMPLSSGAPHPDVVLVTIDSVRADHTSLAGYRWPTTPNLAALAARATRFDGARSPSPLTRRAVPALLYGRMAATLPFSASRRWPLIVANQLPTLATTLAAAGYRTAAIVSHRRLPLSDATYRGFAEVIGLSDELVSRHHDNADAVVDRALAWLAAAPPPGAADPPRFLWIHLIDPHYPYAPPAAAPALGAGASAYDREIAFADVQVGRLLAALSADRTIVAVTADHGEAFGEHHVRFHGKSLDEGEVRVPLVIAAPGGPPSVTAAPVTLVDLAPTLLDLAGVDTPAGMTGASLAATVRTGASPPRRPVVIELFANGAGGRELVAVMVGEHKLIRDLTAWTVTAYDVAADPGERAPLTDPAIVGELTRALEHALDREQARLR